MAIRVVVAVFCFHLLVDGSISAPNSATAVGRPKRDTSERYASSKLVGCMVWTRFGICKTNEVYACFSCVLNCIGVLIFVTNLLVF